MTISEFKKIFRHEVAPRYTHSEADELCTIFVEKATGLNRMQQRTADHQLSAKSLADLKTAVEHLKNGMPFQQILGETEFYGLPFFVDENVLIPRPETEELLELAIGTLKKTGAVNKPLKILDIGTGSGIIPIILKKHFPHALISAIDFSPKALCVAKKNASFHQTEILLLHADYLNEKLNGQFDVIISNPPYIGIDEKAEIAPSVKDFEPGMALFSPVNDPLIFYRKIAADCQDHLNAGGMVFLEINQKLGPETQQLFENILSETHLKKDISGNDRFVFGAR